MSSSISDQTSLADLGARCSTKDLTWRVNDEGCIRVVGCCFGEGRLRVL